MRKIISTKLKFVLIGKNDDYFKKIIFFLKKKQIKFEHIYIDKSFTHKNMFNFLKTKNYDYLISYRNPLILKKKILKIANKYNINFHPSPPRYRGVGGYNLAILNSDKEYGVTAHLINNQIDNGLIIDFIKFKISKKITLKKLISETRKLQFNQIKKILNYLILKKLNLKLLTNRNKKKNYKWSKKIFYLKELEKLYRINIKDIKIKNLSKIIRSTYADEFKPEIIIDKYRFVLLD